MSKPHIKDQFQFPTVIQDHKSSTWETVIGRRNLLTTSEHVMAGLCANPNVMKLDGDCWPRTDILAKYAVEIAMDLLEEVKRNES